MSARQAPISLAHIAGSVPTFIVNSDKPPMSRCTVEGFSLPLLNDIQ
jgi:hypothetical protein